ncbi:MAG: exodeoxyribonuclease VII small subunit [Rickettsiales bacterium]|jgi:exodeoxyribonuclease VII small subunit
MSKTKNNLAETNFEKLDFETSLNQLEEIVDKLGGGKTNLEEMVELYEKGTALKNQCSKMLDDAKMRVEKIIIEK